MLFSLTANFLGNRRTWAFADIVSSLGVGDFGVPVPRERHPLPAESKLPSSQHSFNF